MTKTNILAIIKYLLQIIAGKLNGKAEKEHTHSEYLTDHPTISTNNPNSNNSTLSWGGKVTAYSKITKDSNGHITAGEITNYTLPSSAASITDAGLMSAADKKILDAIPDTYAKKSDIVNVYRYKGSVSTFEDLPKTNLESGDVYNVGEDSNGKNYAWTGTEWDDLGGSFAMEEITEADIDNICEEIWGV